MWELSRIRYALELSAAEDAVKNMTDQGLERLRQIQAAQREDLSNYNVDEFIRHDREFHSCIYEMSLNRELMKLASNYYDVFRFLRNAGSNGNGRAAFNNNRGTSGYSGGDGAA